MGFREAARAKTSEGEIKKDEDGMRLNERKREGEWLTRKRQGPILRGCIRRKEKGDRRSERERRQAIEEEGARRCYIVKEAQQHQSVR